MQTSEEVQRLKREAVLREAGRLFSKRGYHNISLDQVAETLQISKGTLYNYVQDKQGILWEFHRMAVELGNRAFAEGRALGGTGAQRLRNTLKIYIELTTQELGALGALMDFEALRPEDRTKAVKQRDLFEREFVQLVQSGIQDGTIKPVDPRMAVFTFLGATNWIPRWYSSTGRLSAREIAEIMTDLFLSGLEIPVQASAVKPAPKVQRPAQPKARTSSKG